MTVRHCLAWALFGLSAIAMGSEPEWDVTNTGQPYIDAEFTVDEGTWMSLDVSPDGRTIVFDLLGDIYSMPASGGEATVVAGGPAMQRTPQFSRDGRRILYVSDASGADNVWIANADGSAPRQITHEIVDIIGGAAWGPTDDSVVAVKVYSTFSQMKSSEIRLYDLNGGSGSVLVGTPANRRDVQEPKLSRDGRYVYYTERLNDPNIYVNASHLNYAVYRRSVESGETEKILGGWGSAVAPQVSPDGQRVAFVRRVMEKTVLFVYDIASRRQWPVYDQLDRDLDADFVQQSAYYPRYGWFPDGRSLAIWGKGKIFRIDAQTGASSEIPFRVHARHRITQAVRAEHDVAPAQVEVKIFRRLVAAPDGKSLVVTALGHLWRKPLPQGQPVRLTKSVAFESDPAVSRDGKQLAYVEWDDEHGSLLKVGQRVVAGSRGVIRDPAFSPDGKQLVYRIDTPEKTMGGYGVKAGIYVVAANGGASRFVVEGSEAPVFSPESDRIYFVSIAHRNHQVIHELHSVDLNGADDRLHAQTPDADTHDLRVSPDLKWIAFRENQQYFVMPYAQTGLPLTVTAKSREVPVHPLTDAGGYSLSWSSDSSAVYWTLGAEVFKATAAELFTKPQSYTRMDLTVPADVPKGTVAFTNARILTMKNNEIIERGTLVVEGNKIVAVGSDVKVPAGAKVYDVAGKTLMPGIIDMHGHTDCCYRTLIAPIKQPSRYAQLSFGVTTNFDPYSSELINFETHETDLAGLTVGPRWIGSGTPAYGRAQKTDYTYLPILKYEDARAFMKRKQALGDLIIKSYKQPARFQRQMLIKAGREFGIMVDVEGEGHFYNNITMLLDGHTNLEHNLPVAHYYNDVLQLMAHGTTSNTPTLVVDFGELYGENFIYQQDRAWEDPKVKLYAQEATSTYGALDAPSGAPEYARNMTSIHQADELWDIGFRGVSRSYKTLDEMGVRINVGSHGEVAGLSEHWEMRLLAQGGMSNLRILRAATINGATTLGLEKELGTLEPGKLADLIVLDKDPVEDIRNTNSVHYTMVNGRLYDSLSMNEIGNYNRPRTRFYWEMDDYKGIDWNSAWSGK